MYRDLPGHTAPGGGSIPPELCVTSLKPDIVIIDNHKQTIHLFELTCPSERNIEALNLENNKQELSLCSRHLLLLTPIKIRLFGPKTTKFGPKSAFLVIGAKYCYFLYILSNARPKTNVNKVAGWVFRYVGNKTCDFSSKKKDFLPKIGIFGQFRPGHAGLFSALLVGRLVVVARGLYLARHLFTLFVLISKVPILAHLAQAHWHDHYYWHSSVE